MQEYGYEGRLTREVLQVLNEIWPPDGSMGGRPAIQRRSFPKMGTGELRDQKLTEPQKQVLSDAGYTDMAVLFNDLCRAGYQTQYADSEYGPELDDVNGDMIGSDIERGPHVRYGDNIGCFDNNGVVIPMELRYQPRQQQPEKGRAR